MNPRNGLCLNALHDRAFDRGLMWVSEAFVIHFSTELLQLQDHAAKWLASYDGCTLKLSTKFKPDQELLERHSRRLGIAV